MRIGIDARCLEWPIGGAARILINFLKIWPQINISHYFVLYFHTRIPEDDFLKNPAFECKIIKGPMFLKKRQLLSEQIFLPIDVARDKLDLFFAPFYSAPLLCKCPKTVIAAWDISYTTHGEQYPFKDRIQMSFLSKNSCQRSSGILTCSPFDARQIEKYYKIPADQICTLQLAADDRFQPTNDQGRLEKIRCKYKLPERYLLSMGVILNRRNVGVIIEAFKKIYRDFPDVGIVIIGRNATSNPFIDIEAKMKPLITEGRGVYFARASEDELADFYSGAWYYICTSTVDGEALMLKEAMKCRTPVITSPLLEDTIEGNAVIVKNPINSMEMADVFRKVLSSDGLREEYAEKGFRWVQQLSCYKTAQKALNFIESR